MRVGDTLFHAGQHPLDVYPVFFALSVHIFLVYGYIDALKPDRRVSIDWCVSMV